jgi:hypothetical protein
MSSVHSPNSPAGHGSTLPTIEYVTKYILKLIYKCQTESTRSLSLKLSAIQEFTLHADAQCVKGILKLLKLLKYILIEY